MIRIVKMHFRPENTADFLSLFERVYPKISTFPGCSHLELLRDKDNPSIFFTYSFWDGPQSLDNYRNSQLFKETWMLTKALFEHKAQAWSVEKEYPE